MSVYRPKGSEIYVYDFQRGGHRFSGTTGARTRREAQEVEKALKGQARSAKRSADRPMTLEAACERYWNEIGQFIKRPDSLKWSMTYIMKQIGKDTPVEDISTDDVSALVAKRRGDLVVNALAAREPKRRRRNPTRKRPPRRVSAATVNRSVLEPLKRIMLKAQSWGRPVQAIEWKKLRLKEPKERIRSMTADEEARLFAELPPAFVPIVRFALRTGCRASECTNLKWSDVDWGGRRIAILGKGDKLALLPMEARMRALLWPLQAVGAEYVFRLPSSERIVYAHFYSVFRRAVVAAGISDLRIHDLRHTAATRLVKQTGNIKLAMKLLRHEDISTTSKYTEVLDDDLRDALDAMPDHEVPVKSPEVVDKSSEKAKQ